jgi:aryl-alcohol dehydrogenase-like predicted oxidoreductase
MGTMTFGREADEDASADLFKRCREAGINFFDTANVYAGGESERILGRLIADCRDELVLTSKVAVPTSEDVNRRGAAPRHLRLAVEQSLKRLKTDRLDVYFIHVFDGETPIEQTLRGLEDLRRQGKIVHAGVSNWAAWQVARALGTAERHGWDGIQVVQPMYNLLKRQAEVEILPMAEAEQLAVIPYNPLGAGLLTGKYLDDQAEDDSRMRRQDMYARRYGDPTYAQITRNFVDHAKQRGVHPVTLAIAWVLNHPAVTSPILGARSVAQLEPALKATEVEMSEQWRSEISALSIEPPPPTDRSEERD